MLSAYYCSGIYLLLPIAVIIYNTTHQHLFFPYYLMSTPERQRLSLYVLLLLAKIFPIFEIIRFSSENFGLEDSWGASHYLRLAALEIIHVTSLIFVSDWVSASREDVSLQEKRVFAVEKETEELLEKLPEGIVIVDNESG